MYNSNIYNKDTPIYISVLDSLKYNRIFYIAYFITFLVIGIITKDIPKSLFTGYYMAYHAYFMHIIAHKYNPFKKFHGLEINELDGVAIMTDTDNSKMKAVTYYQNIYFSDK